MDPTVDLPDVEDATSTSIKFGDVQVDWAGVLPQSQTHYNHYFSAPFSPVFVVMPCILGPQF